MQNCWSDKYFVNMMKTYIYLIRTYWRVSHSSASPTYTQGPNLFITVPLDARVLDGTRPSAGAVLTTKSHIFFCVMKFHWLPPSNYYCDAVFRRHTMQAPKWIINGWNWTVLRPRQNGRHFSEDTLQHIIVNENLWISIKISLKFVPEGQINNIPALVQIMAWCRPGDMPLFEWVNTLRQRQNDQHLPEDIFKCIFLNENISIPIQVSLKFVLFELN